MECPSPVVTAEAVTVTLATFDGVFQSTRGDTVSGDGAVYFRVTDGTWSVGAGSLLVDDSPAPPRPPLAGVVRFVLL